MKDLSLHIMDILQNSITAGADDIKVVLSQFEDNLKLIIEDNGKGMDEETIKKVSDPYFTSRTTRKVGMGIPLLKQNTERTEGKFEILSQINKGTKIISNFKSSHIDMLPLGDIGGVMALCMSANPDINFTFSISNESEDFTISTNDIKEILQDVPITDSKVIQFIKDFLNENIDNINNKNNN